MRELLEALGYRTNDDLVELIVTGIAILPALLMLAGFIVPGGLVLWGLLCLLAAVGSRSEVDDHRHGPHPPGGK